MTPNEDGFRVWVDRHPLGPGQLGFRGAMLKDGPQVAKTVTVSEYGDVRTRQVKKRELRFSTTSRRPDGTGFAFGELTKTTWACEDDEMDRLLAFLQDEVDETGRYRLIDSASPQASLMELLASGGVDVDALVAAVIADGNVGELVRALSRSAGGLAAAESAVIAERRELVARLQDMAQNPATTETDMQRAMGESYWLFGGRYVGVADRRNLAVLDQHDIPLLGADGTLHIVELKGPNVPRLVRRHRNHLIVGNEVHEATSQAVNYIRGLDEQGLVLAGTYRNEFGSDYDMRRVFATVVIGHPAHVQDADAHQVEQTVRTYNSHLSRVEVITWAALLDSAQRALDFEQEAAAPTRETPLPESPRRPTRGATSRRSNSVGDATMSLIGRMPSSAVRRKPSKRWTLTR